MEKEQLVSRLVDEIDIPSDKFGLVYDIIEYCVDSMLRDLQNENKSLVKTLEKYNEEMIELRKCNQDLLNTVIEAQKVIKNVLEAKKWVK